MVFNRFALLLMFRVALLLVVLIGLSIAVTNSGYYGITLLLGLIVMAQVIDFYRYVSRTNAELTRFLEAARYGDFSQRFEEQSSGAGFDNLAIRFSEIMQRFSTQSSQQEAQLQQLKAMTEHIPVPLMSLFPDGRIVLHNHAARHLFVGVSVTRIENLEVFGETFCDVISTIEPGSRRLVNFCDDGIQRQLTVMMSQIVTGTLCENLISMQDIQSELDSAQLRAWQELVQVLTHEIMNSITPVASLAKSATDLVDDVRDKLNTNAPIEVVLEELEDVHRAVSTVSRRSDGLMQFVQSYRSLTQMPTPKKQMLALNELFQRVEGLLAQDWQGKDIALSVLVEPEHLTLYADPDLIEQVLINLLKNAEQAMSDASNQQIKPQVCLSGRMNQRGLVLLEVSDNGPGISETLAKEIFVPFFTTKRQGSGVGLALTRQIMIAHGGNVTVNPSDIGGAKFTLIF
jgi:two-component system nitrogen regulation sensor histidine kinase NtrY